MDTCCTAKTRIAALVAVPNVGALPIWTGAGAGGLWSNGGNWSSGVAPGSAESPIFGAAGSGLDNIVDRNFAVTGLTYGANNTHRTLIGLGNVLQVKGLTSIGSGSPVDGAGVTWGGGGSVTLGASGAAQGLWVGVNNSAAAAGTTTGRLNLESVSVGGFFGNLSIGRKTSQSNLGSYAGGANGSLVLGSNSTLTVGTAASRAAVSIGQNEQSAGTVSGVLDVRQGNFTAFASDFNVGASIGGTSAGHTTGTIFTGARTTIDAVTILIGNGANSEGRFNLEAGTVSASTITVASGGTFKFTGGCLNVGTFNGTVSQLGGVLSPGLAGTALNTLNNGYLLSTGGTLEIDLKSIAAGSGYDKLIVKGAVDLNADHGVGASLDLHMGYAGHVGETYIVIDNDGNDAVLGTFIGIAQGGQTQAVFGHDRYTFAVSYVGGTGNDVTLQLTGIQPVPEPMSWALWICGLAGLGAFKLRRGRAH